MRRKRTRKSKNKLNEQLGKDVVKHKSDGETHGEEETTRKGSRVEKKTVEKKQKHQRQTKTTDI